MVKFKCPNCDAVNDDVVDGKITKNCVGCGWRIINEDNIMIHAVRPGGRDEKGKPLMKCRVKGCDDVALVGGMCRKHYEKHKIKMRKAAVRRGEMTKRRADALNKRDAESIKRNAPADFATDPTPPKIMEGEGRNWDLPELTMEKLKLRERISRFLRR